MALHELATGEMAVITKHWLGREYQRPIIQRFPRLAPFLDDLAEVHKNVAVFQNSGKGEPSDVASLRVTTSRLDADHDRLARGIHHLLLGAVEIIDGEDDKARWEQLHKELFPQGLSINQQRYLVQAGEVVLREQRLSDESRELLATTSFTHRGQTVSLQELLERWDAVAEKLGAAEAQKLRLQAGQGAESSRGPARRAWVSAVGLFLQVLEREKGLTDDERRELLEPLRNAEAKAAKRRALARKKNEAFDPDAEVAEEELGL